MRVSHLALLAVFAAAAVRAETYPDAVAKSKTGNAYFAGASAQTSGEVDRRAPWVVLAFGRRTSGELIARRVDGFGSNVEIVDRAGKRVSGPIDNGVVSWTSNSACPALAVAVSEMLSLPPPPTGLFIHGTDGVANAAWSTSGDPQAGLKPKAVSEGNTGSAVGVWLDQVLVATTDCWRADPPG